MHAPIDSYTFKHITQFENFRHLGKSGCFFLSWKRDLEKQRYTKIQECIRELSHPDYDHALHYEMSKIWNKEVIEN